MVRKMTATGIVVLFTGLSAASSGKTVTELLNMLTAMRFLLGIGVGAEYPCGSVAASEQSEEPYMSEKSRHRWLALATNHMLDWGFVIASLVPLILVVILGNDHLRAVWRLSLGLGVVPVLAVFIWRLSMDEPTRYKKDSMKYTKIPYMLVLRRYGWSLAKVSFIWFLYDFVVYPFALYSSVILNNVTGGSQDLKVIFGWNVVINLFYIPGALIGAFAVDYLGPKGTLISGLLAQALVGFIMSSLYANKTSPTAIRGQFYGIAAAVGKVGAFVGTWAFPPMIKAFGGDQTEKRNTGPFWVGSGLAILSAIVALFLKPLDEKGMAQEDQNFREYLEENGYDTAAMGLGGTKNDIEGSLDDADEKDEKGNAQVTNAQFLHDS
ncbi:hypothetical protein CVT24_000004 [Panaeolus cyanescens]|uniref:Major facilitator superfamily (MFS) profile domain-containing protein n=1 Tax=Panaeolus cyanescens TaxID=181874 RepID=A0A409VSA5_9AGAR|nr:hypothetical protein CVT24_000004 [Panaeolus cyanescens]